MSLLDHLTGSTDMKGLSSATLGALAAEIRGLLIGRSRVSVGIWGRIWG